MAITIGFNLLLVSICLYAIWRGGLPEQLVAAGVIVASAATSLGHLFWETHFRVFQVEIFIIDSAFLVFLMWVAFKARRSWPLWATAVHSTAVAVHLAKALKPEIDWPIYALFAQGSGLVVLALLWLGTIRHRRRLRLTGADMPWRSSSLG